MRQLPGLSMSLATLLFGTASVLAIAYIVMGAIAISHVEEERREGLHHRWPVYFFYWPYYKNLFAPTAHRIRLCGAVIFPILMIMYLLSVAIEN
jgi:hypothetical protein